MDEPVSAANFLDDFVFSDLHDDAMTTKGHRLNEDGTAAPCLPLSVSMTAEAVFPHLPKMYLNLKEKIIATDLLISAFNNYKDQCEKQKIQIEELNITNAKLEANYQKLLLDHISQNEINTINENKLSVLEKQLSETDIREKASEAYNKQLQELVKSQEKSLDEAKQKIKKVKSEIELKNTCVKECQEKKYKEHEKEKSEMTQEILSYRHKIEHLYKYTLVFGIKAQSKSLLTPRQTKLLQQFKEDFSLYKKSADDVTTIGSAEEDIKLEIASPPSCTSSDSGQSSYFSEYCKYPESITPPLDDEIFENDKYVNQYTSPIKLEVRTVGTSPIRSYRDDFILEQSIISKQELVIESKPNSEDLSDKHIEEIFETYRFEKIISPLPPDADNEEIEMGNDSEKQQNKRKQLLMKRYKPCKYKMPLLKKRKLMSRYIISIKNDMRKYKKYVAEKISNLESEIHQMRESKLNLPESKITGCVELEISKNNVIELKNDDDTHNISLTSVSSNCDIKNDKIVDSVSKDVRGSTIKAQLNNDNIIKDEIIQKKDTKLDKLVNYPAKKTDDKILQEQVKQCVTTEIPKDNQVRVPRRFLQPLSNFRAKMIRNNLKGIDKIPNSPIAPTIFESNFEFKTHISNNSLPKDIFNDLDSPASKRRRISHVVTNSKETIENTVDKATKFQSKLATDRVSFFKLKQNTNFDINSKINETISQNKPSITALKKNLSMSVNIEKLDTSVTSKLLINSLFDESIETVSQKDNISQYSESEPSKSSTNKSDSPVNIRQYSKSKRSKSLIDSLFDVSSKAELPKNHSSQHSESEQTISINCSDTPVNKEKCDETKSLITIIDSSVDTSLEMELPNDHSIKLSECEHNNSDTPLTIKESVKNKTSKLLINSSVDPLSEIQLPNDNSARDSEREQTKLSQNSSDHSNAFNHCKDLEVSNSNNSDREIISYEDISDTMDGKSSTEVTLVDIINKYKDSKNSKKVPIKYNFRIEEVCNTLIEYLTVDVTNESMDKLIQSIINVNETILASAIVAFINCERQCSGTPIHVPELPTMSYTQQTCLCFMKKLNDCPPQHYKSNIFEQVMKSIEFKVFNLSSNTQDRNLGLLTRYYATLCHITRQNDRLKLFCVDALYSLTFGALTIIEMALKCWPFLLPKAKYKMANDPLVLIFVYITINLCTKDEFKNNLKPLLCYRYGYDVQNHTNLSILESLLLLIKDAKAHSDSLQTAVILFGKYCGAEWCYTKIILSSFFPILDDPKTSIEVNNFTTRLIGPLAKPFPLKMMLQSEIIIKKLVLMLRNGGPHLIEEAVVHSLTHLSNKNYSQVSQEILQWVPKEPISGGLLKTLEIMVKKRNQTFWKKHKLFSRN